MKRIPRADLRGTPGPVRDARKDQAARRRRPQSGRCRICCAAAELEAGICKDRAACEQRMPPLS